MSNENNQNSSSIRSDLKEDKPDGSNFLTWYRKLRVYLRPEKEDKVLERPLPVGPQANAGDVYETVKLLFQCKWAEGALIGPHLLKMMGYIEDLRKLGSPLDTELANDIILNSLPESYIQFILNYKMQNQPKTVTELCDILMTVEPNMKRATPNALMVQKGKGFKKPTGDKGRGMAVAKPEPKSRAGPNDVCWFCEEKGHWRKDCKAVRGALYEMRKYYDTSS